MPRNIDVGIKENEKTRFYGKKENQRKTVDETKTNKLNERQTS